MDGHGAPMYCLGATGRFNENDHYARESTLRIFRSISALLIKDWRRVRRLSALIHYSIAATRLQARAKLSFSAAAALTSQLVWMNSDTRELYAGPTVDVNPRGGTRS